MLYLFQVRRECRSQRLDVNGDCILLPWLIQIDSQIDLFVCRQISRRDAFEQKLQVSHALIKICSLHVATTECCNKISIKLSL